MTLEELEDKVIKLELRLQLLEDYFTKAKEDDDGIIVDAIPMEFRKYVEHKVGGR